MSVKLNDRLIEFFSKIEIKYEWKTIFNINIMDYFPLLKNGITQIDTSYNIIVVYGLFHNFIDLKSVFRDRITDKLIYKIFIRFICFVENVLHVKNNKDPLSSKNKK